MAARAVSCAVQLGESLLPHLSGAARHAVQHRAVALLLSLAERCKSLPQRIALLARAARIEPAHPQVATRLAAARQSQRKRQFIVAASLGGAVLAALSPGLALYQRAPPPVLEHPPISAR